MAQSAKRGLRKGRGRGEKEKKQKVRQWEDDQRGANRVSGKFSGERRVVIKRLDVRNG